MERNIVIVHETSDVNELSIENVSASEEVFVHAGDIVKGGRPGSRPGCRPDSTREVRRGTDRCFLRGAVTLVATWRRAS